MDMLGDFPHFQKLGNWCEFTYAPQFNSTFTLTGQDHSSLLLLLFHPQFFPLLSNFLSLVFALFKIRYLDDVFFYSFIFGILSDRVFHFAINQRFSFAKGFSKKLMKRGVRVDGRKSL
ncbi:hypothetical protein V8G54_027809 [Vigna mungo]|uniref:Uncharacterized protein n=1 Tax=Vigna mungo TaxID=3915 RepID=A0AAQ3RHL5_VIGMU